VIFEREGVSISAKEIQLGEGVSFGRNVDIRCVDSFSLGDRSHLGDDVKIRGREVRIGADLYHSRGLDVGGGGCDRPNSILSIGDRCTIHDNHINLAERVSIGNDVGLSPSVTIYTHGFWWSVLEGFPAEFGGVSIGHGAIIGYRTLILPSVTIGDYCVVGAQSIVAKSLPGLSICVGSPARKLRDITRPSDELRQQRLDSILREYAQIAEYHGIAPRIEVEFPRVRVNDCTFDVLALTCEGKEDEETDDFRDAMRRYGLRFYTQRPFRSALKM
jgi:acetyltransferase-like isoleucine patch superfamily enzyme